MGGASFLSRFVKRREKSSIFCHIFFTSGKKFSSLLPVLTRIIF